MTEKTKKVAICSVKGCDDEATTKGMCPKHYQRFRQHGDANAASKRDKLTPAQVAEIRAVEQYRGINVALAAKYGVTESTISSIRRGDRRPVTEQARKEIAAEGRARVAKLKAEGKFKKPKSTAKAKAPAKPGYGELRKTEGRKPKKTAAKPKAKPKLKPKVAKALKEIKARFAPTETSD